MKLLSREVNGTKIYKYQSGTRVDFDLDNLANIISETKPLNLFFYTKPNPLKFYRPYCYSFYSKDVHLFRFTARNGYRQKSNELSKLIQNIENEQGCLFEVFGWIGITDAGFVYINFKGHDAESYSSWENSVRNQQSVEINYAKEDGYSAIFEAWSKKTGEKTRTFFESRRETGKFVSEILDDLSNYRLNPVTNISLPEQFAYSSLK